MAGMLGIASAIFKHLILKPILPPVDQVNTYFSSDTREAGTLTLILVTTRLRSPFSSLYFISSFKFALLSSMQSDVMVHGELSRLENPARFRTRRAIPACSLPFRRISHVLALLL